MQLAHGLQLYARSTLQILCTPNFLARTYHTCADSGEPEGVLFTGKWSKVTLERAQKAMCGSKCALLLLAM